MHTQNQICKEFGSRVRALREGLRLSQEDLAELAKVHRTLITIKRLAEALSVQAGVLLGAQADHGNGA